MEKTKLGLNKFFDFLEQDHVLRFLFVVIVLLVVTIGYLYPFLRFPFEAPNPWPEAYNVIQQEIIDEGKVPPDYVIQYGENQKTDMTFFLNHHLMAVSQKLVSGLPFQTSERFLTFALTAIIFLAAYLFFRYLFGEKVGFLAGLLFIFLPRNLNYYVNINGEFFGFILLFLSLYFWFRFKNERKWLFLILSGLFVGIMPTTCLITFGVFFLFVLAFFITDMLLSKKRLNSFKLYLLSSLIIFLITLILSVLPLYLTGNIKPGGSSSIGSLYSKRSAEELSYEKKYYEDFATYGNEFIHFKPFMRDIYFLTLDGSNLDYFLVFYLSLFFFGLIIAFAFSRHRLTVFLVVLTILFLLLEIFLYSSIFNYSVYNSALRFLLYFGLPTVMLSALALSYLCWKSRWILPIFTIFIFLAGIPVIKYAAYFANSYSGLYPIPFKKMMSFLKTNTPADAMIVSNDWANGQFWLESRRRNLIESGKASATYLTYKDIYEILSDGRSVFRLDVSNDETWKIINKRKIEYIVVWNRPSAYEIYPYESAKKKLDQLPGLEKVFDEKSTYAPNSAYIFEAESTIYKVNMSQAPQ